MGAGPRPPSTVQSEGGSVDGAKTDVSTGTSGRWRHAARWHRVRPDLSPADAPPLVASELSAARALSSTGFAVASGRVVFPSRTRAQF